jgi:putative ABC transport system permease protein
MATHLTWFGGQYKDPKNFFAQMPVVPEEFLKTYPEFILPAEQKEAWLKTRTGAIVGSKCAERFQWKVGSRVTISSPIWGKADGSHDWEFEIVGIFTGLKKSTDTSQMYFRHDYFEEARQWGKGSVGWYIIEIKDPDRAAEIARQVDYEFENSPAETKAEPEGAFVQSFAKQVGDIALITASILSAVFFTILLVAGNTMAQSVRERTGELGALKAMGFTNTMVLSLILAESCLLSLLGGMLGLGLAWLLTSNGDPTGGMLPLFFLPRHDLLLGMGITVVLGLVTGIIPALQAMNLRVADALRRM